MASILENLGRSIAKIELGEWLLHFFEMTGRDLGYICTAVHVYQDGRLMNRFAVTRPGSKDLAMEQLLDKARRCIEVHDVRLAARVHPALQPLDLEKVQQ